MRAILIIGFVLLLAGPADGQVQRWTDESGTVHIEGQGEPVPFVEQEPPGEPLVIPIPKEPVTPKPDPGNESPPRVTRPAPRPRPLPPLRLDFGKRTNYLEGSWRYVQGTVLNKSRVNARYIKIKAKFFDRRGNLVKIEEVYADPIHLPPGGEATYSIMTREDPDIYKIEMVIFAER